MASALCTKCGKKFNWYPRRGHRLTDILSPCCQASAKGYRGDPSPRKPKVMASIASIIDSKLIKVEEKQQIAMSWDGTGYQIGYDAVTHYVPTDEIIDDYRVFIDYNPLQQILVFEKDWQLLLSKINPLAVK